MVMILDASLRMFVWSKLNIDHGEGTGFVLSAVHGELSALGGDRENAGVPEMSAGRSV